MIGLEGNGIAPLVEVLLWIAVGVLGLVIATVIVTRVAFRQVQVLRAQEAARAKSAGQAPRD